MPYTNTHQHYASRDPYDVSVCVIEPTSIPDAAAELPEPESDTVLTLPDMEMVRDREFYHQHQISKKLSCKTTATAPAPPEESHDKGEKKGSSNIYSIHFGTTMIDQGRTGRDYTVLFLVLTAICFIAIGLVVAILILVQPWATDEDVSNDIIEPFDKAHSAPNHTMFSSDTGG